MIKAQVSWAYEIHNQNCVVEMIILVISALTDIKQIQEWKNLVKAECLEQSEGRALGSQRLLNGLFV